MYGDGVNVNLTAETKLNFFKELKDQIEPKNNKGTKMNQTKMVIKRFHIYLVKSSNGKGQTQNKNNKLYHIFFNYLTQINIYNIIIASYSIFKYFFFCPYALGFNVQETLILINNV